MRERQSVVRQVAERYRKARKRDKTSILDEFVAITGYDRCYASSVLRTHGKRLRLSRGVVVVGDVRKKATRKRQKTYGEHVQRVLIQIWLIMGCICGKRLAPILQEIVTRLEKYREITLDALTRQKLLRVSPATIDRLVAPTRKRMSLKGRSLTKPGTLLKHQIPIHTFSDWDEQKPGFVEIDLVGHDGGNGSGEFAYSLNVTDVATGWTETQAVKNKAQRWVFEALKDIRERLPFPLLGIDSDNGSEFINHHLLRYCQQERITFTRTRSYRKNDNCFVEQKNYSIVRRAVGYSRYDTPEEQAALNELYQQLRLYSNFFQPSMKLIEKIRIGSKVTKKYDKAQAPYQRVLACPDVSDTDKRRIRAVYAKLNPAALNRRLTKLQHKLLQLNAMKHRGSAA
jgi:hypothetical protein